MPQPDEQQPSGRPEPGSPSDWLRYARSDLALAELVPPSNVLLETLCFHAQQVAEKALKAMLLHFTSQEPPFIHDIGHLLDGLRPHISIPSPVARAARLTEYAVLTRYPADLGEVDESEWREAVSTARAVIEWAESVITT